MAGYHITDVRIVSDCSSTARCIRDLQETMDGHAGSTKDPHGDRAALRDAVLALGSRLSICVTHPEPGCPEHRACHNAARRYARAVIMNPQSRAGYRLIELHQRLDMASRERDTLRTRVAKLDRRIAERKPKWRRY